MPRTHLSHMGRTGSGLGHAHMDHIPIVDEDLVADMDEPPERKLQFSRQTVAPSSGVKSDGEAKETATRMCRSPSLLTQGLLTSPDIRPMNLDTAMARAHSTASNGSLISSVSTAELTSDGGLTSPARTSTPSPPFPSTIHTDLGVVNSKTLGSLDNYGPHEPRLVSRTTLPAEQPTEPAPLRRRCITFACPQPKKEKEQPAKRDPSPPRKTCLKFACPSKPKREAEDKPSGQSTSRRPMSPAPFKILERRHRDSQSTIKGDKTEKTEKAERVGKVESPAEAPKPTKKTTNPDGLRFHEFAPQKIEEEAWITATPTSRHKITVNDTLRKENAIRKLGEEAEEEALAEEEEEEEELDEELDELDSEEDEDDEDEDSDECDDESDGNETDDEEGFAASDDESDDGSEYAFWTPATTTAATSVEHLEHIRPRTRRSASESSIESSINTNGVPIAPPAQPAKRASHHKSKRSRHSPRVRPGTPELPDSTDFVCGTFDEDRPLEAAYLAMKEQRRIAKNGILPQDVDPSFPTSDPEQDDDLDEEDEASETDLVIGKLEVDDETPSRGRGRSNSTRTRKTPNTSPAKRAKSPAPQTMRSKSPAPAKRNKSPAPPRRKSPAPRRLFGRSPRRGPPPPLQNLPSPPSSRRNSIVGDSSQIRPGRLAQRPNLTRTKSLPRTPNPFFSSHPHRRGHQGTTHSRHLPDLHRSTTDEADEFSDTTPAAVMTAGEDTATEREREEPLHSRGPIDIVQGLEQKRARRKEKFWRLHCRQKAARPARIGKGKGAERMRDVGLEMVERTRGYGTRLPLVLSV